MIAAAACDLAGQHPDGRPGSVTSADSALEVTSTGTVA
jgi:hypothetical protein